MKVLSVKTLGGLAPKVTHGPAPWLIQTKQCPPTAQVEICSFYSYFCPVANNIPTYGINKFNRSSLPEIHYQVEIFDTQRSFQVEYPHRHHGFYEILYLTAGSGIHVIDFKSYEIKPHSIFFLSPGQVHTLDLSDDVSGYIFLFTSEFYLLNKQNKNRLLEFPFFFHLQEETPPLYLEDSAGIEKADYLFRQACGALLLDDPEDKEESLAAILDLILLHCKQAYPVNIPIKNTNRRRMLVKRFKQLIEENYHLNFAVRDYAEKLAVIYVAFLYLNLIIIMSRTKDQDGRQEM